MKKTKLLAVLSAITLTAVSSVPMLSSAIAVFADRFGTLEDFADSLDPEKNLVFPYNDGINQKHIIVLSDDGSACYYNEHKQRVVTVKDGTSLDKDDVFNKITEVEGGIYNISGRLKQVDDNHYFIDTWCPCKKESVINALSQYEQVLSIDNVQAIGANKLCSLDGVYIESDLTDEEIEAKYPALNPAYRGEYLIYGEWNAPIEEINDNLRYFECGIGFYYGDDGCYYGDYFNNENIQEYDENIKLGYDKNGLNRFDVFKSLQNDEDIKCVMPSFSTCESMIQDSAGMGKPIENLYTAAITGDLNADGAVNISDVVAIGAYISNPEANPLNEQKIINGDVHNTGDGLTASDALMIQQYLAGIITEL